MKCTAKEILQYVEENDVKFVKLTFCDMFGRQKNVSIVSQQLASVFENGHLIDSSAVPGFANCAGDLLLFPDPKTLTVLPWRPQMGEVVSLLSYIKHPNGSFFEGDTLHLLETAKAELAKKGISCEIGTECDFYVFKLDNDGNPTLTPIDRAGYFDCSPADACENLRRDIILSLEDMGIVPTSSHHERGPGQNEIEFVPTEAANAARNFLYFKSAVKNVSHISGLKASFSPKPLKNSVGSGMRITMSLGGVGDKTVPDATLDSFAEGVLNKSRELIAFLNSTPESYELFGEFRAPAYGAEPNRTSYISTVPGKDGHYHIDFNAADCKINPFLVFALLIKAGLYGVENKLKRRSERFVSCDEMPRSLGEALDCAEKSDWLREVLTDRILDEYIRIKRLHGKSSDGLYGLDI